MKQRLYLILLFYIICCISTAQNNNVNTANIDFHHSDGNVYISYDIVNYSSNELYNITLLINRENGSKLNAISLTGDLVEVEGGAHKVIVWNQKKDGYVLDDKISVTLLIATKVKIPVATHLLKSLIYPGLGDYKVRNGKYHFIYGLVGYGAIGASIYMNQMASKSYSNYKNSFDFGESNKLFNKATQQQKLSMVFATTACVVWTIDLGLLYAKTTKVRKQITKENSEYYFNKTQQTNTLTSAINSINTKTPYDLALERGDKLFEQEKYEEAKLTFEEAKSHDNTETVQNKISSTTKIIAEQKAQAFAYEAENKKAQDLTSQKRYAEAKAIYENMIVMRPKAKYPQEKIEEINTILNQIENQKLFDSQVQQGSSNFTAKNYETAKTCYQNALKYKADDTGVLSKIAECDNSLAIIEQNKIDAEYKQKMQAGFTALNSGKYEVAKDFYEQAKDLKPNQSEPQIKIDACDNAIAKMEEAKNSAEYKRLINLADGAYNNKQFDKAKGLYMQAQNIMPGDSYPNVRIATINKKMDSGGDDNDMVAIYEKCKSGVFYVMELGVNYWDEVKVKSQGSGFFVSSSGIGISNYHVLNKSNYKNSVVILDKDNIFEIEKIIEQDEGLDYVIFKVKLENKTIPYLKVSSVEPKVTNKVFAIGNPEGLARRYAEGRVNGFEDGKIAIDVSITHGSSGGPLFNMKGEVIGITSGGHSFEGGNFNLAVNIQKLSLNRFIK